MPSLDQLLDSNLTAAVIGLAGVVVGVLITARMENKRETMRAVRDRQARQEEYVRRRRDEFENILAEFVPIHKQWRSLQELAIRDRYAEMSDTDPMSDEEALEASEKQLDRLIAQLSVRSPSDELTRILENVAERRERIWQKFNYVNHVGLDGDEDDQQDAKECMYKALVDFGEEIEVLVRANSADARGAEVT